MSVVETISDLDADLTVVRARASSQLTPKLTLGLPAYVVMYVDTLVYWSCPATLRPLVIPEHVTIDFRPDSSLVAELTGRIFSGYKNHYAANPLLSGVDVGVAYADWASRHAASELPVRALRHSGRLVAVATLLVARDSVEILLAGVDQEYRGHGLYQVLLHVIESFAVEAERPSVLISTQVHNVAAQRAWARFGFRPVATFDTIHVMKDSVVRNRLQ
jgi:ribosomal protein S18 acetylase RimI-like enzyme